jgi:alpha-1,2-mannosyltransferase
MPTLSFPQVLLTKLRTAHASHPGRFRLGFLGLLAIVLVVMSLQYLAKASKPGESGQQTRSAFLRWRAMIRNVFDGVNVYTGLNEYPNPPIMVIVLRPFAELPPIVGAMAWFYAKVAMAALATIWIFRLVKPPQTIPKRDGKGVSAHAVCEMVQSSSNPSPALSDTAKAVAILLALPALMGDLSHNNVNIFILFLLAGCLELYRRGWDTSAGFALGLSIACKVTPLLFLAYFVWKRAWRVVGGCLVGLVLWLAIVPGLTFGWNQNAQLLTDWYKLMIERPILKGEITTEHANQALPGFIYRLFTHSPSYIEYLNLGPDIKIPQPAAYHNIADIGRPVAWWVVKALTAAFALAIAFLCRAPRSERQGWQFAAECGLIVLGMLLLSERTWKHHAVTLLLPAAVLAYAASLELPGRHRKFITGSLAAAWFLMTLPGLFGSRMGDLAMVYGTHTLAFLLLTAAVCVLLIQRPRVGTLPNCEDNLCGLSRTKGLDKLEGEAKLQ